MISLGLIGKGISHSKSQEIYESILNQKIDYTLFDFPNKNELLEIPQYFESVQGISITAPFKKNYSKDVVIKGEVSKLGIINCIRKNGNIYEATNTDYLAVKNFLSELDLEKFDFLLLGNGSMAEITRFAFNELGIPFSQLSRSTSENFDKLDLVEISKSSKNNLFVINSCARAYTYSGPLAEGITFWDYNYEHINHINRLKESNIRYIDGMELLKNQAKYALKFWGINY